MEIAAFVISVIAVVITIAQYFAQTRRSRMQDTLDAYNDLQDRVFEKINQISRELSQDETLNICDSKYRNEITGYLANIERFCVGINTGIYDKKTVKRCGGKYLCKIYGILWPVIEEKRNREPDIPHYNEFEKTIEKLRKMYK